MAQVRKEHGSDYSTDPEFWLRVFDASRTHNITEYLRYRRDPWLKSQARLAALRYATLARELRHEHPC